MHRRIEAVLIVAFALVLAVRSDGNLKCYMCTSLTKQGCESDPAAHNLEPVDCSLNKMVEWQQTVQKENILRQLSSIFEVDNLQHHQASAPMACAKMILKVDDKDVTVRSCQTAKTDTLDPCKAIEGKLASNAINMEHCDLCSHDACNDSTAPSSRTLVVLMSVLGAVAFGAFYHNA